MRKWRAKYLTPEEMKRIVMPEGAWAGHFRRPAQRVSIRKCAPCGGNGKLTPGGNKRKTRVCGNCGGRGYNYVGGNARIGTWF